MCLGLPGKVLQVDGNLAQVDFFGLIREVRLDIVDEPVAPGDYILNHVGFAIHRIPEEEVDQTLALFEEIMSAAQAHELLELDTAPNGGRAEGGLDGSG